MVWVKGRDGTPMGERAKRGMNSGLGQEREISIKDLYRLLPPQIFIYPIKVCCVLRRGGLAH